MGGGGSVDRWCQEQSRCVSGTWSSTRHLPLHVPVSCYYDEDQEVDGTAAAAVDVKKILVWVECSYVCLVVVSFAAESYRQAAG